MIEYELPEVSGNTINGLGVREVRPPRHVYHAHPDDLEWKDLQSRFTSRDSRYLDQLLMRCYWQFQYRDGAVAKVQSRIADKGSVTQHIKEKAREFGADAVGITLMRPEWIFQEHLAPGRYFLSVGVHMEMDALETAPERPAQIEVIRVYSVIARLTVNLARYIRAMGYPALAHPGPSSGDVLQIPGAIEAGLGQLGKHGSMISDTYGSAFRLGAVTTDLPLEVDQPREIGVDDFCQHCHLCTEKCPPDAISDDKQQVRGVVKWFVDFDKCAPYFSEMDSCTICLAVCPWSQPGVAPKLFKKMMIQRSREHSEPAQLAARKRQATGAKAP